MAKITTWAFYFKITKSLYWLARCFSPSLLSLSVPSSLFSFNFYSPRIQPLLEAEGTTGRKNKSNQILLSPFPECREASQQSDPLELVTHLKPASTGLYHCSLSLYKDSVFVLFCFFVFFVFFFSQKDSNNPVTLYALLTLQHT